MSNTAVLETVLNENTGHIILSYNISLLLHALLLKHCRNNKMHFYNKCWEQRTWFSCLEEENCSVSGNSFGDIIKISFLLFKASTVSWEFLGCV